MKDNMFGKAYYTGKQVTQKISFYLLHPRRSDFIRRGQIPPVFFKSQKTWRYVQAENYKEYHEARALLVDNTDEYLCFIPSTKRVDEYMKQSPLWERIDDDSYERK